ncbi:MAG TPA: HAD-IA family hydrolase [Bryobacteraceae bacterium]|nr:HAD-IA family hydrolase [Bryobacteraceae bacterium]
MKQANPSQQPLLIFDLDGVLVDVSESYRETIARTVEHFTGHNVSRQAIQEFKNAGGWNDDWQLSHHIVSSAGLDVPFETVKTHFQTLFHGVNGTPGLILRERWIAYPGMLEQLSRRFRFALFTGRPKEEAQLTLDRFAPELTFDPIVGMYDIENHKPAPDGLLRILRSYPDAAAYYIGDTIDDARAARAAVVPFIGVAAPDSPLHLELVSIFQDQGARAILGDINYLPEVFGE